MMYATSKTTSIVLAFVAVVLLFALPHSAEAYTYNNPPTSSGAVTGANTKCTGTFSKSLGSYDDTTSYSWNTYAWSFLDSALLPADYNAANTYCIQGRLTSITDSGGGGGGGGGGGNLNLNTGDSSSLLTTLFGIPKAFALGSGVTTYTITYGLYTGAATTTTSATDYYALTYRSVSATPTANLSATPASITSGNSSALTWSSTGATSCTGTGFSTGSATSGTVSVSPTTTTTYSVTCTGAGGTSPAASATVTVTATLTTATLSATPSTSSSGGPVTLTWSSTNASRCVGAGGEGTDSIFSTGNAPSGSVQVRPQSNITYTVSCYSADYSAPTGGSCQGPQYGTYNPTCNADAERKDIDCPDGYKVKYTTGRYCGTVGNFTGYQGFAESASCVVDTSCGSQNPGSGSSAAAQATVTTDGLTASCSASPTTAALGQTVTWTATATGGGGTSGTWQHTSSDIQDFACPLTDMTRGGYNNVPDCSPTDPTGLSCTAPGSQCKYKYPSGCSMYIELYECQGSGASGYTYSWTGTDGLTGSARSVQKAYGTSGTKTATVTVFSPHQAQAEVPERFALENVLHAIADFFAAPAYALMSGTCGGSFTGGGDTDCSGVVGGGGTPPPPGSYDYVTVACEADANPDDGIVTVSGPAVTCDVAPSAVTVGGSATYTAHPSGGATGPYTWTPVGGASCASGTGATKDCTFPDMGTYRMTVTASGSGSPSDTCPDISTSVAPISYITASPTRVNGTAPGGATVLSFSAANVAASCTVTGPGGTVWGPTAVVGDLATTTANVSGITKQSTYTINCDSGATTHSVIVNITARFEEF